MAVEHENGLDGVPLLKAEIDEKLQEGEKPGLNTP